MLTVALCLTLLLLCLFMQHCRRFVGFKAQGGVKEMERRAIEKADMLYAEIDRNKMFVGTAA